MPTNRKDLFLLTKGDRFATFDLPQIGASIQKMDEAQWDRLMATDFNSPTWMLIVSILGGTLGVDRFLNGETGLGLAKLLTCGGAGLWYIVDLFVIMDAVRRKNFELFQSI